MRSPLPRRPDRPLDGPVGLGKREAHHHVLGPQHDGQATFEVGAEVERGQGALADDHRVHELHRDVLRVGSRRTVPERQEPPSGEKTPGHLVAGFSQSGSLILEERPEDSVAAEQFCSALSGEILCVYPHLLRPRHPRVLN